MERQKLWLCIGIAFLLLLTVAAAILLTAAEELPSRGASFVACTSADANASSMQAFDPLSGGGLPL